MDGMGLEGKGQVRGWLLLDVESTDLLRGFGGKESRLMFRDTTMYGCPFQVLFHPLVSFAAFASNMQEQFSMNQLVQVPITFVNHRTP